MRGFVDDDGFKRGKLFHGYRVLGSVDELERIYRETAFDAVLIAGAGLSSDRMAAIEAFVGAHNLQLRQFSMGISEVANGPDVRQKSVSVVA